MPGRSGSGLVAGRASDRRDRRGVGFEIALGVLGGARALAEHVEGIAIEPAGAGLGALERLADRLAEHEMAAHDAHRLPGRRAHRPAGQGRFASWPRIPSGVSPAG
jgi:hypothetical protein